MEDISVRAKAVKIQSLLDVSAKEEVLSSFGKDQKACKITLSCVMGVAQMFT